MEEKLANYLTYASQIKIMWGIFHLVGYLYLKKLKIKLQWPQNYTMKASKPSYNCVQELPEQGSLFYK